MLQKQKLARNIFTLAITLAVMMPVANALEIKAEVSGTVGGSAFPTDVDAATSDYVDVLSNSANGASDIFYHTYGSATGNFGSRVSGNGVYDLTGIFSYKDTITNASGVDQAYNFDFTVIPGELSLMGTPTASGEFLMAEYSIDILVGGQSIWDSSAKVEKDSSTTTFTYGGTSLGGGTTTNTAHYSSYMWGEYLDTISLGTLGDGESLDFEYLLTARAAGNTNCVSSTASGPQKLDGEILFGDGAQGEWVNDGEGEGQTTSTCGSIARSGDPFNFGTGTGNQSNFINISSAPVTNSVPEPGSLALMALGLAGVIGVRRRKNKSST